MDDQVLREIAARREWRRHEERIRAERRRARTRRILGTLFALVVLAGATGGLVAAGVLDPGATGRSNATAQASTHAGAGHGPAHAASPPAGLAPHLAPQPTRYGERPAPPGEQVSVNFGRFAPRSALLWNIDSGEVLWSRDETRELPIASLTKMMTALLVDQRSAPQEPVRVTRAAVAFQGSGVGQFKLGMHIGVETMLYGLLLPSGNDAAIALAQHVSGTLTAFVSLMNQTAARMGLGCTRFARPDGFQDQGNHSCAADLAILARDLLSRPRLAQIVAARQAIRPFPARGGRLYLFNNNPLLVSGYPGTIGVKTGYTNAAGHCLVAAAQRGAIRLGVVLLHTPGPPGTGAEAARLFNAGFRAMGA